MKKPLDRRNFLTRLGIATGAVISAPFLALAKSVKDNGETTNTTMEDTIIKNTKALGFVWDTQDPFLFCVHHEDYFPKGNENMGPDSTLLQGRHMGDDFIIKDGFRMYHGKTVPGFPGHPHRGFETVTVVRQGLVDHADSLGAAGRYGDGDVQWMTAGKGVQHSEMFPLINKDRENTMELFQIWLNLPKKDKMVEPHFKMLWGDTIPKYISTDTGEKKTTVEVIAGKLDTQTAPAPPPNSWASDIANNVCIWNITLEAGATWTIPKTEAGMNRTLYFYVGDEITIAGQKISKYTAVEVFPDKDINLVNTDKEARILMLQGKPIGEPVIQYGPFVMNTKEEIMQAFDDYHATQFGGWPWPRTDQVHPREKGRFAKHADGKVEEKDLK